jgi:hypothetical protein
MEDVLRARLEFRISRMRVNRRDIGNGLIMLLTRLLTPRAALGVSAGTTSRAMAETSPVISRTAAADANFPLSVSSRWRCLEDAGGRPFLVHGDTPWSLIVQLTKPEAELYLQDRRSRGFNTLLVNLIEHHFARNPPADASGDRPFEGEAFSALNEEYFAHADWVLRRAEEFGFLVLLTPAYLGYGGGQEGWYEAMKAAGPERLYHYGRLLGARYKDRRNIVWVHCGDYDPPDRRLIRAIADGIREEDKGALHTAHGGPETDILEYWNDESWLAFGNIYTYKPVWMQAQKRFSRSDRKPFILIESAYENEHGATELRVRAQAYQALLSGACGQMFGNNPIWAFGARTAFDPPMTWREALNSRGAQSMTHLRDLFAQLPWWRLVPDFEETFLLGGHGRNDGRAVAAVDSERRFALVFLPSARPVTLDLERLTGGEPSARWYDPAAGQFRPAEPWSLHQNAAEFQPPSRNAANSSDWVLLVEVRG